MTNAQGDSVLVPKTMWFRLPSRPVVKTMTVWTAMKNTIHTRTMKCTERAICLLAGPAPSPNRAAIAGAWSSPVTKASGAKTKTVRK